MSMFNDINLERKDNEDSCGLMSRKIKQYASIFFNDGHWAFLGPAEESKWYQGYATDSDGKWDLRASQNVGNFREFRTSGISGVSPLDRGILKKKNNRDTILFNGEYGNNDMLYRTVDAAIYGAVSKWRGPNSGEASQSRPESARKMSPEIQRKQ